jgi:ABC-type nitrate/sulfonate/bicarbonate transport system substrate-binding protein
MKHTSIRLGGVPEHFNRPIHQATEKKEFEQRNIDLSWTTFKGGTGQMTKALRNDEVDACILLTEGIIKDIIQGNPSKIISQYVTTPLTWGIHTGFTNELQHYGDIFDQRYAISRFGSGSHLMAIIDAHEKGKTLQEDQFKLIKNLDGALKALTNLDSDVFYWEKYTTKPYVDKGLLRRVGEFVTPWPCFVIAATNKVLSEKPEAIIRMLRTIHDVCDRFMMDTGNILDVSKHYDQKIEDVERWFHNTEWAIHGWVSNKMVQSIIFHLRLANIISADELTPELIWKRE